MAKSEPEALDVDAQIADLEKLMRYRRAKVLAEIDAQERSAQSELKALAMRRMRVLGLGVGQGVES